MTDAPTTMQSFRFVVSATEMTSVAEPVAELFCPIGYGLLDGRLDGGLKKLLAPIVASPAADSVPGVISAVQ